MKAIFIITTLVAIAAASHIPASSPARSLKEDLLEFVDLLPLDELTDLVVRYITSDKDFQKAFLYLQDEEFSAVWDQFFAVKEVKDVLNHVQDTGLQVYELLNEVADFLGLNHVESVRVMKRVRSSGLSGFFDEVLELLPVEELKALYEQKLKSSPEFKAFFDKVLSLDFQKLVDFYQGSKETQAMVQKLRDHGVDVDKFFDMVAGFFWIFLLILF